MSNKQKKKRLARIMARKPSKWTRHYGKVFRWDGKCWHVRSAEAHTKAVRWEALLGLVGWQR